MNIFALLLLGPVFVTKTLALQYGNKSGHTSLACDVWEDRTKDCKKEHGVWSKCVYPRYCKPAFLFIGCEKCGSTSFYHALMQHPNFKYTGFKELMFWKSISAPGFEAQTLDNELHNSVEKADAYFQMFKDIPVRGDGSKIQSITGEFSTSYYACLTCPTILKKILPQAKLVLMFREPFSRAVSRYKEQLSMQNALLVKRPWQSFRDERFNELKSCVNKAAAVPRAVAKCAVLDNVFGWSMYADLLQIWVAAGYSPANLQILYLDDFASNATAQMRKVEKHLDLPQHEYNVGEMSRHYNHDGKYAWNNGFDAHDLASGFLEPGSEMMRFYEKGVEDLRSLCQTHGWPLPPASWSKSLRERSLWEQKHAEYEALDVQLAS